MDILLSCDSKATESINSLKKHYGVSTAEVFTKGLMLLKVATKINEEHGELVARRGSEEKKIIVK